MAVAATLEITVPADSRSVRVQTVGADVYVSGVTGEVDVTAMTGTISIASDEWSPSATAFTISGPITVSGPFAVVQAESVTSDITLDGFDGTVRAATTGGQITVRNALVRAAELRTGMGEISVDCDLAADAALRASTTLGGSIDVTVPRSFEGLVTLSSGSGDIDYSAFEPEQEVVTVFEDTPLLAMRSFPGIALSVTEDGEVQRHPSWPALRNEVLQLEIQSSRENLRLAGLGRDVSELRVGDGDARIYLDCQGLGISVGRSDDAPVGIVLRTR